ncbi:MAG TPA: Hsp20/alpha crystallin family protein [Armatimonadota bacterium]|nr:Hsp20/alpha crystallin family protein [Armatimonadota bacterium]
MRRNSDLFPVRREQDWGFTPWSDFGALTPSNFFGASPWQVMRRMQEDMDRVFNQVFTPALQGAQQVQQWAPSVDVSQDEKEWLIEAELPGVSQDQIDVQLLNHHLILRAELRQEEKPQGEGEQQGRQYQRRERRYGYFERVLPLPQNVDEEAVRCEFVDGVLKLHLPKVAEQKPQIRRIPIGGGQAQAASLEASAEPAAQSLGQGAAEPERHEELTDAHVNGNGNGKSARSRGKKVEAAA